MVMVRWFVCDGGDRDSDGEGDDGGRRRRWHLHKWNQPGFHIETRQPQC